MNVDPVPGIELLYYSRYDLVVCLAGEPQEPILVFPVVFAAIVETLDLGDLDMLLMVVSEFFWVVFCYPPWILVVVRQGDRISTILDLYSFER